MNGIFHSLRHAFHHRHHLHHHLHGGHRGPRGFAGFGGHHGMRGSESGQPGLDGLQRGRKLGAAGLQLLLLALLAERPSHGYELIKALDERSNGYYSPSPGMVYPALTYLEEIGHASFETQGTKKLYSVTDAGRAYLHEQRAAVDALLKQLAWIGSRMERLRQAMAGDGRAADDAATGDSNAGPSSNFFSGHGRGRHAFRAPAMRAAWRGLQSALIDRSAATEDEQRRIAAILEGAAAAIRQDGGGGGGGTGPVTPGSTDSNDKR